MGPEKSDEWVRVLRKHKDDERRKQRDIRNLVTGLLLIAAVMIAAVLMLF